MNKFLKYGMVACSCLGSIVAYGAHDAAEGKIFAQESLKPLTPITCAAYEQASRSYATIALGSDHNALVNLQAIFGNGTGAGNRFDQLNLLTREGLIAVNMLWQNKENWKEAEATGVISVLQRFCGDRDLSGNHVELARCLNEMGRVATVIADASEDHPEWFKTFSKAPSSEKVYGMEKQVINILAQNDEVEFAEMIDALAALGQNGGKDFSNGILEDALQQLAFSHGILWWDLNLDSVRLFTKAGTISKQYLNKMTGEATKDAAKWVADLRTSLLGIKVSDNLDDPINLALSLSADKNPNRNSASKITELQEQLEHQLKIADGYKTRFANTQRSAAGLGLAISVVTGNLRKK